MKSDIDLISDMESKLFEMAGSEKSSLQKQDVEQLLKKAGSYESRKNKLHTIQYSLIACIVLASCFIAFFIDQADRAKPFLANAPLQNKLLVPKNPNKPLSKIIIAHEVFKGKSKMVNSTLINRPQPFHNFSEGIKPIVLNKYELSRLGINVIDKKICINNLNICLDKEGLTIYPGKKDFRPGPLLITDDEGNYLQSQIRPARDSISHQQIDTITYPADLLVPVLVCGGDNFTGADVKSHCLRTDIICWFAPTDTFFNRLPPRYHELQRNYDQLIGNPVDNASCEYYEACKNTLAPLADVSIYPNPVIDKFYINIKVEKDKCVDIALFDINGRQVMSIARGLPLHAGVNNIESEAGCLSKGVYLIELRSEGGEVAYQRLMHY
jgi:hypothetical protein